MLKSENVGFWKGECEFLDVRMWVSGREKVCVWLGYGVYLVKRRL